MSDSKSTGHISLTARYGATEFRVIDSNFRLIAEGVGQLRANVKPGIYRIESQLGTDLRSDLAAVHAGETYEDSPYVAFASAAPVEGTSTSHEYQQEAASLASENRTDLAGGGDSALVMVIRSLPEQGDPPISRKMIKGLKLLDTNSDPIPGFASTWKIEDRPQIATWSANLPAGGYKLLYRPNPVGIRRHSAVFCHPIWLSPSWQTLLFLRSTPFGLTFDSMSVHMTEKGSSWQPWGADGDPASVSNETLAVETALAGMSLGRRLLPDGQLQTLLNGKFMNPMFGILGAHSMLLDPPGSIDKGLLEIVMANLYRLVGNHPDVAALSIMAEPLLGFRPTPDTPFDFPPMLLKSFEASLRHDATNPGTIADGSTAETAAASLVVQGLWTTWRHFELEAKAVAKAETAVPEGNLVEVIEEADVGDQAHTSAPPPSDLDRRGVKSRGKPRKAAKKPRKRPTHVSPKQLRNSFRDPAAARVADYLAGVAEIREIPVLEALRMFDEEKLSLATSLPRSTVRRVLPRIGKSLGGR